MSFLREKKNVILTPKEAIEIVQEDYNEIKKAKKKHDKEVVENLEEKPKRVKLSKNNEQNIFTKTKIYMAYYKQQEGKSINNQNECLLEFKAETGLDLIEEMVKIKDKLKLAKSKIHEEKVNENQ